jgi:hypothetical protein
MSRLMIDTIAGKFETGPFHLKCPNSWETLTREYYDFKTNSQQTSRIHSLALRQARISVMGDGGLLRVEASLPKLVYGNNLESIVDPAPAFEQLTELVLDHVGGEIRNVSHMEFLRVDYAHNFTVGNHLQAYVDTVGKVNFLKHRRTTDGCGGIEWWSKNGRRIRFYDKHKEILETEKKSVPEAKGVLRFEIQLRKKSQFLQRRLNEKHLTLGEVTKPAVAYACLSETLNRMGFDLKFVTRDRARDILDAAFGYRKATRLLGVLRRLETEPMEHLRSTSARSTFYADKKDLRLFGLWPPSSTQAELPGLQLPPLSSFFVPEMSAA